MIPTPAQAFVADVAACRNRPRGALAAGRVEVKVRITAAASVGLDRIRAEHRGAGDGSAALRKLIEIADRHRVTIHLMAVADYDAGPYAGTNPEAQRRLVAWYRRAGFVPADGDISSPSPYLTRPPRGTDALSRPEAAFAAAARRAGRTDLAATAARVHLAALFGAEDAEAAIALLAEAVPAIAA